MDGRKIDRSPFRMRSRSESRLWARAIPPAVMLVKPADSAKRERKATWCGRFFFLCPRSDEARGGERGRERARKRDERDEKEKKRLHPYLGVVRRDLHLRLLRHEERQRGPRRAPHCRGADPHRERDRQGACHERPPAGRRGLDGGGERGQGLGVAGAQPHAEAAARLVGPRDEEGAPGRVARVGEGGGRRGQLHEGLGGGGSVPRPGGLGRRRSGRGRGRRSGRADDGGAGERRRRRGRRRRGPARRQAALGRRRHHDRSGGRRRRRRRRLERDRRRSKLPLPLFFSRGGGGGGGKSSSSGVRERDGGLASAAASSEPALLVRARPRRARRCYGGCYSTAAASSSSSSITLCLPAALAAAAAVGGGALDARGRHLLSGVCPFSSGPPLASASFRGGSVASAWCTSCRP